MAEYSTALREQFAAIGRNLQERREAQGLTLQNIATFTRISPQVLRGIESGDLDTLPALVFVKGFIRNYMQALSIEDNSMVADLEALDRLKVRETEAAQGEGYSTVLDKGEVRVPWGRVLLALVVVALMGWVVFLVVEVSGPKEDNAAEGDGETPAELATAPEDTAQKPPAPSVPAPAATPAAAAPQRPAPPIRETLRLTVQGLERTWIRVAVDNATPIDVMLEPADSLSWEARSEFRLTVGRAQGVRVTLEGEEFQLPNEPNALLPEMVLNRETLLLLQN